MKILKIDDVWYRFSKGDVKNKKKYIQNPEAWKNSETSMNTLKGKCFIYVSNLYFRMAAIGRTTEWHEGHQKNEVLQRNKMFEKMITTELKHANSELKNLRHERLAQLYKKDAEQ